MPLNMLPWASKSVGGMLPLLMPDSTQIGPTAGAGLLLYSDDRDFVVGRGHYE